MKRNVKWWAQQGEHSKFAWWTWNEHHYVEKGLWAKASSCMNMLAWCSEVKEEAEIFGSVWKPAEYEAEVVILANMYQDCLHVQQGGRFWSSFLEGYAFLLHKCIIHSALENRHIGGLADYYSYFKPVSPLKRVQSWNSHYPTGTELGLAVPDLISALVWCVAWGHTQCSLGVSQSECL